MSAADVARENRELHTLRAQVAAVLAWCDLADESMHPLVGVLHTSTVRAAIAAAAVEAREVAA